MNAPKELDFTWRDTATGLIHEARAEGMRLASDGNLAALRIFTRCGMRVAAVDGKDANTGDVTCVLCLEGDWIPGLFESLSTPAREPALASIPGEIVGRFTDRRDQ